MLKIKRIYDAPSKDDGFRVLVDRLWPRGMKKERADLDLWLKEIAPSITLRKWFGHDMKNFAEFQMRYVEELSDNEAVAQMGEIIAKHKNVTLLYAAKDPTVNHAVVLRDYLQGK